MFHKRDARIDLLAGLDIFARCDRKQLASIAALSTQVTLPAGTVLCRRGEQGREAFVLVEGSVAVCVEDEAIAVLRPGAVFGEMSLLDGNPRVANVTATDQVSVLVLTRREFVSILDEAPGVAAQVYATLGARKHDLTLSA